MADLPKDRMCIEPPFTHCGVDILGRFRLKMAERKLRNMVLYISVFPAGQYILRLFTR